MSDSPAAVPDAASLFFGNYLTCLAKASVPERQRRWYVKRVEEFIRAHEGRKIKTLIGSEIAEYLARIGGENRLAGWQFYQCLDAMRIIYCQHLAPFAHRRPMTGFRITLPFLDHHLVSAVGPTTAFTAALLG